MRAISYKTVEVTYTQLVRFANEGLQAIAGCRYTDPRTSVAVAVIRQRITPLLDKYSRKHKEAVLEIPEGTPKKELMLMREENTKRLEVLLRSSLRVRNFPDLKLSDVLAIGETKPEGNEEVQEHWEASQFTGDEIASLIPFFNNDVFTLPDLVDEDDEEDAEEDDAGLDWSDPDEAA